MIDNVIYSFILLFALFASVRPASAGDFHTDPACWDKPRLYHPGPPSDELARKIERTPNVTRVPRDTEIVSPNGAYKAWVEIPNKATGNVVDQILYVYAEQDRVTRFYIEQAQLFVKPTWINEKLIFVRVQWGRTVFTDLIIDAESGELLYQEEARDGQIAFEQYKEACNNTCPCDLGETGDVTPNKSKPAQGEVVGHLQINSLLNHDLDSRVAPPPDASKTPLPIYVEVAGKMTKVAELTDPTTILTDGNDEWQSALVFRVSAGWYQIGMAGDGERKVWVKETDVGDYTSLPQALVDHLAFLNENWDGRLWKSPDGKGGFIVSGIKDPGLSREEYAAEFSQLRETETGQWLKVRLLSPGHCESSETKVVAEGWVPAWSGNGKLVGGYHARGC